MTALAHQGALTAGFVWDDHALIEQKESVHALQPLSSYLGQMFWSDPLTLESRNFYRPLVSLSFTLDWLLGKGSPFSFHLTNLLAHLSCAALLFLWLRKVGASPTSAGLLCSLWATFPRLTESVTWISGRTDVFATLGLLGALVLWPFDSSGSHLARRVLAACSLLLGLLAKEVAVAGLVGIAGVELIRRKDSISAALVRLAPMAAVLGLYGAGRLLAHQSPSQVSSLGLWRPVFAVQALGTYVTSVIDFRPSLQVGLLGIIEPMRLGIGGMVILAAVYCGSRWLRGNPPSAPLCSALVGLGGLGLVVHLIPLPMGVVACDRFLYLPMAMASFGLIGVMERHRLAQALALLLLIVWSVSTSLRVQDWSDELRLFADLVKTADPRNAVPPAALGDVLRASHHPREAAQLYRRSFLAEQRYDRERVGQPTSSASALGRLNLALVLEDLGEWEEAGSLLQQLRRTQPTWPRARYGGVMWALRRHDWESATRELDGADADLGVGEVSSLLRAQLIRSRTEEAALPPEVVGESFEIALKRLTLARELGAVAEATGRWQRLLDDSGCDAACAQEGLAYIVIHAPPALATLVVQGRRLPWQTSVALEAVLAQRSEELAVVRGLVAP